MTTNVGIGLGSKFWLDNASGTLTLLDELLSVTPPNPQVADVEATHMGSTAREFIAGLTDYGEGAFEFNFIPNNATDQLIRAAIVDKVGRSFKVVLPIADGTHSGNHWRVHRQGLGSDRSDRQSHDRDADGSLHQHSILRALSNVPVLSTRRNRLRLMDGASASRHQLPRDRGD
jgi:hypothetical protein